MSTLGFLSFLNFGASNFRAAFLLVPLLSVFMSIQAFCADGVSGRSWPTSDVRIAEARLVDIHGHSVDFARDAVADRIVVINFIYSSCRTLCPFSSAIFSSLQERLGSRLGRDVWFISLTLDPRSDTPDRLEAFANQFEPSPAWMWLTGAPSDMEEVLSGLGASAANFKEHAPLILIGDAKFGRWTALNSTPSPTQIEGELKRLWAAREASATAGVSAAAQSKSATP